MEFGRFASGTQLVIRKALNISTESGTTFFSFQRINQDSIHEELDNALQREHEAKLLLQEQQQQIQELSNTLELHSCTNKDRSQVSDVPLMVMLFFWNSHQSFTFC